MIPSAARPTTVLTLAILLTAGWHNTPGAEPLAAALTEADLVMHLREELGLDADHHLVRAADRQSVIPSDRVSRYRHVYRGLDVFDGGLTVRLRDGQVLSYYARIRPDLHLDTVPRYTRDQARATAEAQFADMVGAPLDTIGFDSDAIGCGLGVSAYANAETGRPRLLYRCRLSAATGAYAIYVDATSGEFFTAAPLRLQAWQAALATGQTVHHGLVGPFDAEFDAELDQNGTYRLQASNHITYDHKGVGAHSIDAHEDFTSTTLPFDGENKPGVSVHWATERALSHYADRFGIDPLLGQYARVDAYVNTDLEGAHFDPDLGVIFYGQTGTDWVVFDVVAHEVAHLAAENARVKIDQNGNYIGLNGEFGTLHESFGDIFAQLAEEATFGVSDWIVAKELDQNLGKRRDLVDPSQSKVSFNHGPLTQQPDVYQFGPYWVSSTPPFTESNDFGGTHIDNSIANRWFTLLAFGGTGINSASTSYQVEEIGTDTAAKILYTYLIETLVPGAGFFQARQVSEQAAIDLCGALSQARISVVNAWYAVGVEPTPVTSLPYARPYAGQIDVGPWPVSLSWRAEGAVAEPAWLVQISTEPGFPPGATQTVQTFERDMESGMEIGVLDSLVLKPATTYYWRVRSVATDAGMHCWRPAMSFTTADQIPTTSAPNTYGTYHPWSLPFSMAAPLGSEWVDIQVAYDNGFVNSVFPTDPTKEFPAKVEDAEVLWTTELHVPKDQKKLFWRTRARHSKGGTSDWSGPLDFTTIDPKVTNSFPTTGSAIYPWNALFSWMPLPGAASYWIATKALTNGTSGIGKHSILDHSTLLSFPAAELAWQWQYQWTVEAKGPPLGSDREPEPSETSEKSKKSDPWSFVINGDATKVTVTRPVWSTSLRWCHPLGASLNINWNPVPEADKYRIDIAPISVHDFQQTPPAEFTASEKHHVEYVPGAQFAWNVPNGNKASINFPSADPDLVGFAVSVTASGPGGMPGLAPATPGRYYLLPAKPVLRDPALANVQWPPNHAHLLWESAFAPGGRYFVEIYKGAGCNGSPNWTYNTAMNPVGGNAFAPGPFDPKTYSYRVRPDYGYHCPQVSQLLWSNCGTIGSLEPPPDPQANKISCGQTVAGGNEGLTNYIVDFHGSATGQVRLIYDHYCVPDRSALLEPDKSLFWRTECEGTGTGQYDLGQGYACTHAPAEGKWQPVSGQSYLYLEVSPQCLGSNDTWWEATVDCNLNIAP